MAALCVLGIETSCDETAAAVVRDDRAVLADIVHSQLDEHARFGGVVPELAARAHISRLDRIVARALEKASCSLADLDAVAVTAGPGLAGGLLVGVVTAQALATVHGLPLVAVNHLEAHALTARLTHALPFPYLLLLVSGGHCQLVVVEDVGRYRRLGGTVDDAVGEAFDKVAKMLGLGFPGGPAVERMAARGDPERFSLPRPFVGRPGCDFSFSGLKTAVRQQILSLGRERLDPSRVADLCASFQAAVCASLVDRTRNALRLFREGRSGPAALVVAGGVAANRAIRSALARLAQEEAVRLVVPPPHLCTDNAVMVAWAAIERLGRGMATDSTPLVRTRWPLARGEEEDEASRRAPADQRGSVVDAAADGVAVPAGAATEGASEPAAARANRSASAAGAV
ncbi:tRNA N6-adenosine threonylcarbamoyltransferase [bacterium HR40]|nr:tRNA N6-adenosine threonylcarbamoyltransferase [bacterium HR40]